MSPAQVKQNTKNERKVKKNIIIIGRTKPSNRMRMDFGENIRLEMGRSDVIGGETKHKKMETIWKLWNSIEFFSSEEVSSIQSIWFFHVRSFWWDSDREVRRRRLRRSCSLSSYEELRGVMVTGGV